MGCCKVHHKGCPAPGESWISPPAAEYDCNAGLQNFVKGWSVQKKQWCCNRFKKGCLGSGSVNMFQASGSGFGAGAQNGPGGAPVHFHTWARGEQQLGRTTT